MIKGKTVSGSQTDNTLTLMQAVPDELINSTERILEYAKIPKEHADLFRTNLEIFSSLKDKSISNTLTRKVRETITMGFFEIYTSVLNRVWAENNRDKLYQLFLTYGYMDEKLMRHEQTNALYELHDQKPDDIKCSVDNIKDWLGKVYRREKDPSVNEFEQDYYDVFREKKKRGELFDKDKLSYDNNVNARLKHEVDYLFKMGQKLCYGKLSEYVPILHNETVPGPLTRALVRPAMVEDSLNKVLAVDFSAFYRETVYHRQEENKIGTMLIMKSVLPDFILIPPYGCRAVLWQELSGRSKSSPGRFILPIFTDENLDNLITGIVAKFRWGLSRGMSDSVSNRGYESSLFVDYTDYIQTYRKNRDLSNEAKEKIKKQIDRKRNNMGEIFADDYLTWINYESRGLPRLNKIARKILFKYCPFAKSIRESLKEHPLYNQMIAQYDYLASKKATLLQAQYANMAAANKAPDAELMENLKFYQM
ncbi:MAG TPA: hypothetical protein VN426_04210 [Syntrophomonadaceae bacterium]|nr:hypothetical protein [Syntrophomonadaceae bacterium]